MRLKWTAMVLALAGVLTAFAALPRDGCAWQRSFGDEFKGSKLDRTRWRTDYPSGSNGEQQYYAPDAFEVRDGRLRIEARPRRMNGYPYTSGIITTQGGFSQQYGFFEIRARLPRGQGYWPAFWLLPATPNVPWEIDVFEAHGHETDRVYMTNHWPDGKGNYAKQGQEYTGTDVAGGFHIFGLEWNEAGLTWYVDGVPRASTTRGVPAQSMFLLANLAVGGEWPGDPDESTPFPGYMEIDYVRVWQKVCR